MNFQHAGARTTLNTQHNSQLSTQFSTQRTTLNAQVLAQLSTRTILNTLNMQVPAQPLVLVGSLQQLGPDLVLNLRRITSLVHHLVRGGDETRAVPLPYPILRPQPHQSRPRTP